MINYDYEELEHMVNDIGSVVGTLEGRISCVETGLYLTRSELDGVVNVRDDTLCISEELYSLKGMILDIKNQIKELQIRCGVIRLEDEYGDRAGNSL